MSGNVPTAHKPQFGGYPKPPQSRQTFTGRVQPPEQCLYPRGRIVKIGPYPVQPMEDSRWDGWYQVAFGGDHFYFKLPLDHLPNIYMGPEDCEPSSGFIDLRCFVGYGQNGDHICNIDLENSLYLCSNTPVGDCPCPPSASEPTNASTTTTSTTSLRRPPLPNCNREDGSYNLACLDSERVDPSSPLCETGDGFPILQCTPYQKRECPTGSYIVINGSFFEVKPYVMFTPYEGSEMEMVRLGDSGFRLLPRPSTTTKEQSTTIDPTTGTTTTKKIITTPTATTTIESITSRTSTQSPIETTLTRTTVETKNNALKTTVALVAKCSGKEYGIHFDDVKNEFTLGNDASNRRLEEEGLKQIKGSLKFLLKKQFGAPPKKSEKKQSLGWVGDTATSVGKVATTPSRSRPKPVRSLSDQLSHVFDKETNRFKEREELIKVLGEDTVSCIETYISSPDTESIDFKNPLVIAALASIPILCVIAKKILNRQQPPHTPGAGAGGTELTEFGAVVPTVYGVVEPPAPQGEPPVLTL